ncbi:MAG: 2-oxoacid:acceptor oxidoreductase family protein [Alphaproteobacteria bacterium]|nr:2-oxoacid:acceptor oxidoreductase family protein [Alphaproteobacteria bacterium]
MAGKVATKPRSVLIVGVGGQGVIMMSKVLALVCQRHGLQVKQSEVHGMAKRGGGVFSHIRYGETVSSPTIPKGEADVLLAMEWSEGLRWLDFLRRDGGAFIADTKRIVPPFAFRSRKYGSQPIYSPEAPREVMEMVGSGFALDATKIAAELGEPRAANTVLLGVLSTTLEFSADDWREVIAQNVPAKAQEANRLAFEAGRDWADASRASTMEDRLRELPGRDELAAEIAPKSVQFEITGEWCKGCDICVKMCPERCLRLNDEQIAELANPEACTGCRICEWLCPDFAIRVHRVPVLEPVA